MFEVLKQIALTIALVGFGLAVLLPALVNLYIGAAMAAFIDTCNLKEKFLKGTMYIMPVLGSIAFAAYFAVPLYYIWIK